VVVTHADFSGAQMPAPDVLIGVKIISPGSRKTDLLVKPVEYADSGIPHYWVIDLDPPVSLTAYHLAGDFGYQEAPAVSGEFATMEPFPLRVDLAALTAPRSRSQP
jgi:Uma2 family endonuclease